MAKTGAAVFGCVAAALGAAGVAGQESVASSRPWRISDQPTLRVGSGSGSEPVLWHIRDIRVNSQGGFVVANDGESQVLLYNRDGTLARAFGRSGEGPGEFRQITSMDLGADDSILVFDRALQRISVFSSNGTYARSARVDPVPPAALIGAMRPIGNGAWVAREVMPATRGDAGQILRDTVRYSFRNPDGSAIAELGKAKAAMNAVFSTPGGLAYRAVPFTPILTESVVGRCGVIVEGENEAILVVDLDKRTLTPLHTNAEHVEPRPADVEDWMAASTQSVPAQARAQVREVLGSLPIPPTMPIYRDVLLDDLGYIWLRLYKPPLGEGTEWQVYDWTGSEHGVYAFSADMTPRWIGGSQIAVVVTDADDVESIAVYQLDRRESGVGAAPGRACQ